MNKEDIIKILQNKIALDILNMPNKTINKDEPIITSSLIDSFSLVDLAIIVENNFKVRIEDYELNSDVFDTIEQLAEIIAERITQ